MADVNTLLDEHVTLRYESVDRLLLNGYVPRLQTPEGLARFRRLSAYVNHVYFYLFDRDVGAAFIHRGGDPPHPLRAGSAQGGHRPALPRRGRGRSPRGGGGG